MSLLRRALIVLPTAARNAIGLSDSRAKKKQTITKRNARFFAPGIRDYSPNNNLGGVFVVVVWTDKTVAATGLPPVVSPPSTRFPSVRFPPPPPPRPPRRRTVSRNPSPVTRLLLSSSSVYVVFWPPNDEFTATQ